MSVSEATGHNSNAQLKSLIERIEHEEAAKTEIAESIKEIYLEAKSGGYCPKTLRKVIAIRKQDPSARAEEAALLETYLSALGMEG
jgi:uncharacterized protein (UPF0335 family)